ncbi:MAG: hypothetical protein A2589_01225 [Candidatus Vogelbacteria bacterium RIFOXYD1_FULL_46_19]|uniref:Probable peptidoglycan glycosyltransferase FtsW n=1 Tax=Candidatus Vogelbacteria bacterium RIFOXYD1_FULL_46_19 TaxID=1802439 RepID=A0A1G2QG46_9BACT|nr:MAG: hypothetical protein A2589_01225 [Candidatus Vogelbacteria bacterium RIFOXYD1_FULL_46_19]
MTTRLTAKNQSRTFLILILTISVVGFFIFLSASLGMVGSEISGFIKVGLKQLMVLLGGLVLMVLLSNLNYKHWRQWSLPLLVVALGATALVFIPGLGVDSGGATRWIGLAGFTVQPGELLKLGVIIYYAAWLSSAKARAGTFTKGVMPLLILLALAGLLLLSQPDTGTFLVIALAMVCQFIVAGGKWRHLVLLALIGAIALGSLVATRPYLRSRLATFLDPAADQLGSSYQINQSLIAIGSGGVFGRGFGQSLQKFSFLPQPIGDSIFAVAAEEFGFVGSLVIILLFLLFMITGLKIAARAPDTFGRLIVLGLVILIVSQSFINIGAMLGLLPLTGEPLIFVSQGGSALLFGLVAAGIILNVSRHETKAIK